MPAQCFLCVKSLFFLSGFPEKGEFLPFLDLSRGTCMTWELCMPLLLIPYLTCPSARLHPCCKAVVTVRSLTSGWRKGKWKHLAKEQNCCGSRHILQKKIGWSLPSDVSFVCDCWWQLHVSVVQSQVGNETFWIPSGTWSSLNLLDQRFQARHWNPCLVLPWVSEIKGSFSEKE